ncbi:2OG-Fe(II) oxygenase [Roseateles sp.]|uniref:2OG-Fe(II) oxygenase n=1 Tax=Roseateles sp. TaxID=1971397 RepID=UPI0032640677
MTTPQNLGHGIQRLPKVFSSDVCARFIQQAESFGFEPATINTLKGVQLLTEVRNNDRVIFDSFDIALEVWKRVALDLPPVWMARSLAGLNERFRFYRYTTDQKFDWHVDGSFERSNGERSLLTILIYLGGQYEGGETTFDINGELVSVRGEEGDAVVFPHRLRHRGSMVTAGTKYMLRSDVMYYPLVGAGRSEFPSQDALRSSAN